MLEPMLPHTLAITRVTSTPRRVIKYASRDTDVGSSLTRRTGRVAVAWGYVDPKHIQAGEALLDRVAGMLYRLGARR